MANIVDNPRGGCLLAGLNSNLVAIEGVCPIFHSGPGCCMQTSAAEQGLSGNKIAGRMSGNSLVCTNMQEKDVVFGGVRKLASTVQGAIDVVDADIYFIVVGCSGGIIGDDVESVAEQFRKNGQPVYAIESPGFLGDSNQGYEEVWNTFLNQIIEQRDKQEKLVNLFGIIPYHDPFWSGNIEELARLLNRLGLTVNTFYTNHQNMENIKNSSAAALNIIVHPWLFESQAKKFESMFGVPYVRIPGLPIGATDTTKFLKTVAEKLQLDGALVDEVIKEEEDYVYGFLEQIVGTRSWQRFAIVGDASSVIGMTKYLTNDLSMTPKYVVVYDELKTEKEKEKIKQQIERLEYVEGPEVIFAYNQFEINQIIKAHEEVSVIIGSANEKEAVSYLEDVSFLEETFPVTGRLLLNRALAGYKGSLSFTEDLFDVL